MPCGGRRRPLEPPNPEVGFADPLCTVLPQEELLGSREMEQQGRELLHSMRAAEAHQRVHRLADGGGPPALPPAHPAGLPPPEFDGFPKPEPTCAASSLLSSLRQLHEMHLRLLLHAANLLVELAELAHTPPF